MNEFFDFPQIKVDSQLFKQLQSQDSRNVIRKIHQTIEYYDQTKQFDQEMFTILYFSVQQFQKDDILNCVANNLLQRSDSNEFQILQLKFLYESCEYLKQKQNSHLQKLQRDILFQVVGFDKFGKFGASTLLNLYTCKIKDQSIREFLEKHFKRIVKQEALHNYLIVTLIKMSFDTEDCDQQISDLIKQSDDTFFATKYIIDLAYHCSGVSANETNSVRQVMKIFTQISAQWPNLFNQNLQPFLLFYDHENYILRNTASMIITNILTEYLNPHKIQNDPHINEIHEKQRNFLILKLCTRILDKQAYARINTLNMLKIICSQNLIPTNITLQLFPVVIPRVFDVSSFVRKAALTLIKQIVRYMKKIFVEALEMEQFMTISEINDQNLLFQQEIRKANIALDQIQEEKGQAQDNAAFEILEAEEKLVRQSLREKLSLCHIFSQYYQSMELVQVLLPKIEKLLKSRCITDVSKAISLICFLFKQRIENSHIGLMKILTLTTNPLIVETVAKKFFSIFFQKEKAQVQGENLYQLFKYASPQEQIFLELLINQMISKKMIEEKMIYAVFCQFQAAVKNQQKEELEIYSRLVRICLRQTPASLVHQLDNLKNIIESQKTQCNWTLVTEMAKLIKYLSNKDLIKEYFHIFAQILYFHFGINNPQWFHACKEIVNIVLQLRAPESALEYMLKRFTYQFFQGKHYSRPEKIAHSNEDFLEQESIFVFSDYMIKLSQLLYMVGQAAVVILIHVDEMDIYLQNAKNSKEKEETEDDKIFGGCEAEYEFFSSRLRKVCKYETLQKGLFDVYYPHIKKILSKINEKTQITLLHKAAGLCLTKFMCVSEQFCAMNIEKIYKWTKIKNLEIAFKSNLIVGLGDLLNRWPNTVINYCRGLFDGLENENYIIKKSSLHMFQHLILKDTLKISKEMSTIALLVSDDDVNIQSQAKYFFSQIFKKDNRKIINGLFDIITTLSNEKDYLKYQNFITFIVRYLDKTSDQLTERLLKRMKDNIDPYEVRNIAFTLSKLPLKESLAKIYYDCYPYFQERLEDRQIKDHFFLIVQKLLKSQMSNENFQILKEFGELLQKGESKRRIISSKFKSSRVASQITSEQSQPYSDTPFSQQTEY